MPSISALLSDRLAAQKDPPKHTSWTICALLVLAAAGVVLLVAASFSRPDGALTVLAWGYLTALAAFLAGATLGLLFGLPVIARTTAPADPTAPRYAESTSLEQIADWLTKIIVGLTLTQFGMWRDDFEGLFQRVTGGLVCPRDPAAACGTVPGGALVCAFALAGILVGYLWTRRFFMTELARRDAEVAGIDTQRGAAAWAGLVEAPVDAAGVLDVARTAAAARNTPRILASGIAKANTEQARATATALIAGSVPDDPWKQAFGGSASNDRASLQATVTRSADAPGEFKVDMLVFGLTPETQTRLAGTQLLFYLHPTFGDGVRTETFDGGGRAALTLFAYGGFTVGVVLDDGARLELDLAAIPGVPAAFRDR